MVFDIALESVWKCPDSSRVVNNVNAARKFRKFTDVTFVVGPDGDSCTIKAHRVVVGTTNAELANLLSKANDSGRIRIEDVSPVGFKNLIRYIYDVGVKFTDFSSVLDTRIVAEKFKVHKLKLAAENWLDQAVNYDGILENLECSIELDMPELRSECIDNISGKYRKILQSEEFTSAPFEVVRAVLSNPCIGKECRYVALQAIGKWKEKHETDQKRLEHLFKCVDFTKLSLCLFNDFVQENSGLLSDVDFKAFQKCVLFRDIANAPKWYQSKKIPYEKNCSANTEALEKKTSEMKLPVDVEKQKLKVQEALEQELSYMKKTLTEAANISVEFYETAINETVELIIELFSKRIKEAVETSVVSIKYDLESDDTIELASASGIAILPKTECDNTKESCTVLKWTDSANEYETGDLTQEATSLFTECH